ncbi:lamin tail domain-containing protein [Pyxidicoccus xibeiensis]|uniref:lamin tail domain-containing protein n=1 Tax=Pyxidicoccus xibeiensis TaxID=2906759 RepID=UPI0020A77BBB|nr:lamin tail domain-containing protein [Pyxidicoccus xibeiensis]MCP3142740.1 lamin tail domain-containing protein [Pyxidicoccus xibeiensis]
MSRRLVPLARLLGLSVMCLAFGLGCGGGSTPPNPPPTKPLPDAALSLVEVGRASQVASGLDAVGITITVKQQDGTPIEGRTVNVEVSGEGNTVTQPTSRTDAQGRTTASVVSTRAGAKTVTVSVESDGGPVVLATRPVIDFTAWRPTRLAFTATALSASAGAPIGGLEVVLRDAAGRTVASATDAVTLSLAAGPGDAALEGTLTVNAVAGVARFTETVLKKAGTGYRLDVEAAGLEGAASPEFAVAPAAATSLEVSGLPVVTPAGVALSAQVTARDAFGNVATGYTGTLAVTSTDATAGLPAAHAFTAEDAGRFTFTGLSLKRAGSQRVTVQDGATAALTVGQDVGVVAAEARALAFTSVPESASVRATLATVTVALEDAFGNWAAVGAPAVTVALEQGGNGLAGVTEVAPVDGVASFTNLRVTEEGSFQLRASASGLSLATSTAITIADDVPPARPTLSAGATTARGATVTWLAVGDDGHEGTATAQEVRYSLSPITTDAEFTAATPVAGVGNPAAPGTSESATLSGLLPSTSYHVALRVTDNQGQSARSASLEVQTRNADVAQVVFSTQPVGGNAGAELPAVRVSLLDANGDVVTTATSPVTLALVGSGTFQPVTVAAVNGIATFNGLRVEAAGTHRFSATANGLEPVESNPLTIAPGAAVTLALTGLVAPVTAGVAGSLEVTARDAFDNVATGYTGTVHFTSDDARASLPGDHIFTAQDAGRHVFSGVVLVSTGLRRVTVVDAGDALLTDSLDVEVASATAEAFELAGLPADVTAGTQNQLTLRARDRFGNLVTGYAGTVHFTSNDAQAVLPADYTFVPAQDGGQHAFPVTLRTSGVRSVTVTEQGGTGLSVTVETRVAPGALVRMSLALSTATPVAGAAVEATVTLLDGFDNRVSGYRGTVGFRIPGDAQATVPANYAFTEADAGRHTFSVTFTAARNSELIAEEVAGPGLQAREAVVVQPAALGELRAVRPPGSVVAGQALGFVVTAYDGFGNRKTNYTGTVYSATSDQNPGPMEPHTFTAADNGEFLFRVTLRTAGPQTVSFTDFDLNVSETEDVTVEAGPPTRIFLVDSPGTGIAGQTLAPTRVALRDDFDNTPPVTMPAVTVVLSGPAGATVGGTLTVNPVDGVAVFSDLTVSQEGDYMLLVRTEDARIPTIDATLVVTDPTAPAAAPLTASLVDNTTVRLTWRAPGDDGNTGRAASYELRYSPEPIDDVNFGAATRISTTPPLPQGSDEVATVTLPNAEATWYFGLRSFDGAGNGSTLTLASVDVLGPCSGVVCTPPPAECDPDQRSIYTWESTCVVQNGNGVCSDNPVRSTCPGPGGVCFEGACDTASPPTAGQLVVTELMTTPSPGYSQYIEFTNVTSQLLDVTGIVIAYENRSGEVTSFTVQSPAGQPRIVAPGRTFVIAHRLDMWANGVPADYAIPPTMAFETGGRLTVQMGGTLVDDFVYTSFFPQSTGRSLQLSSVVVGTAARQYPWYWCSATTVHPGNPDRGTGGSPNETCAVAINPPVDYCVIQSPKTIPAPIFINTPQPLYSRFYDDQVTNRHQRGNDNFPFIVAELGYGTDPGAPESWTWAPAPFNPGYDVPGGSNDDETMATLNITTPGSYVYGFRYRFTRGPAGADQWAYCDQQGVVGPGNPADYGTVTVNAYPVANHVVISEFSGRGAGTATTVQTDEFIELYNPTSAAVNIGGWLVQYKSATGSSYASIATIPPNTFIRAHGYYLLAHTHYTGSATPDLTYSQDTSASTTGGGHVRIGPGLTASVSDVPVDRLAYGTGNQPEGTVGPFHPAAGGSLERKALPSSTATTMEGGSDSLRGNGADTDNNATDFIVRTVRQPQSSTSSTEQP